MAWFAAFKQANLIRMYYLPVNFIGKACIKKIIPLFGGM